MSDRLSSQLSSRVAGSPVRRGIQRSETFDNFPWDKIAKSIAGHFEKTVERLPLQIAIKTDKGGITYAALNASANRIAQVILSQRPNTNELPVGILVDDGAEQAAAMLGVLKAGKFFVLIDANLPQSRIAGIVADSTANLILANRPNSAALLRESNSALPLLLFESQDMGDGAQNPCVPISPDDIACISYTSGSTGQPKGVIHTHRNLLHQLMLRNRSSAVSEHDRVALLTTGTSNAISNSFQALLSGATLCPFDVRKNGVHLLAKWLMKEKISVCPISSSLFRALCQTLRDPQNFPDLRFLRLRSESACKTDVEQFKKYFSPNCLLVHGLSSSETWALCEYPIRHQTEITGNELPVGYPVQDKEILLLDDEERAVGFNEIGEIVVRSRYLSPGYWRRPDLTELKFRADPFDPEKRLYFTGDLGLMLPDGCLIHKGRKDCRVKIRGFAVDLTEVEQTLRKHPMVKEVAVVSLQGRDGEPCVAAYITTAYRTKMNVSELRRYLNLQLPDYMIPSVFVALDAMPLTPSGKIDRLHLPMPESKRPELKSSWAAPRNLTEEKLEKIWAGVLGLDRVGIHDDFFELGGHSLLAVRLIGELQLVFGNEIPVATLLRAPTVAQLASVLPKLEPTVSSPLIAIRESGTKPPFFCAHGADSYGQLASHLGPDQPFFGLAQHLEGRKVCHTSIEAIAAYYLSHVRRVQPAGPYYVGGHSIGGLIAFEMAQQLRMVGQEVALLVVLDSGSPTKSEASAASEISHRSISKRPFEKLSSRLPRTRLWSLRHHLSESVRRHAKTLACAAYQQLGIPMTPGLKTFYIDQVVYREIYPKAHRRYVPRPYSGRAVYFKSEETRDRVAGWQNLMTERLEVIPVSGNHLSMLAEPNLKSLAQNLKECLAEARANTKSSAQFSEATRSDPSEETPSKI